MKIPKEIFDVEPLDALSRAGVHITALAMREACAALVQKKFPNWYEAQVMAAAILRIWDEPNP